MKDGRFVQVGTPAEVVGQPADTYVRAFTRDVQRGQVLAAEDIMGPPPEALSHLGPPVLTTTLLSELVRRVTACDDPLPVVDGDGITVGTIDRRRVLAAIAGEPGPEPPPGLLLEEEAQVEPAVEEDGLR